MPQILCEMKRDKSMMLLPPRSEGCMRNMREELGNSVVSTDRGGCEEGKVPQKPRTDHTANAGHTSQPSNAVTAARRGAGGGGLQMH